MSIAELLANSGLTVRRAQNTQQLPDGTELLYLHAGQLHVSRTPMQISTILGSCVAVCVWDPVAGIGGMNHYMLPDDIGSASATPRYANFAIRHLLEQLEWSGALRVRLQAKLFGGASVMSLAAAQHLGTRNIEVGRARLREAGIPIVEESTGGHHGRKLIFSTDSGATLLKRV